MTTIPLNKLDLAKANVRKTGGNDGIGELAVSIAAHEPLTSLDVQKAAHDRYPLSPGSGVTAHFAGRILAVGSPWD